MKRLAFVALTMFVLIFALGCSGKQEAAPGSGPGYTMTVTPTEVITDGPVTIDLRLENIFDKDMDNVTVTMKDVPGIYNKNGEITLADKVKITKGQTYPAIMMLSSNRAGSISGKHVTVCFDYDSEYYFDIGLKSKKQATEQLSVDSGASNGPLDVAVSGFENVFYESGGQPGSLTLSNNWQGKISKIYRVSAQFPDGAVKSGSLSIAGCEDTTTGAAASGNCGDYCASSDSSKCSGAKTFSVSSCASIGCVASCYGQYHGNFPGDSGCMGAKDDVCVGATGKPTDTIPKVSTSGTAVLDSATCSIFTNDVAIENGITLRTQLGVDTTGTTSSVERTVGNVVYNYCYDIDLPTIDIKAV